jgi:hypothetical protein
VLQQIQKIDRFQREGPLTALSDSLCRLTISKQLTSQGTVDVDISWSTQKYAILAFILSVLSFVGSNNRRFSHSRKITM